MPKINVYLPDDLAEAVKEAGVPVSAVCQRALELAVRRVTTIRETPLADLDDEPTGALAHFTARTRTVLKLAVAPRRFDGPAANAMELAVTEAISLGHNYIGCEHVLLGLVAEPDGVAGQVLRALGTDPKLARRAAPPRWQATFTCGLRAGRGNRRPLARSRVRRPITSGATARVSFRCGSGCSCWPSWLSSCGEV
ncbi:Clp protease N-terminal domain-containing protein [Streptomyces misionensis]|uniref:Clp protease N-terminal domain-containing protein n=1 Tax=Streptomyces misionensis TaxID=67331 RepID=UPI003407B02D